MMTASDSVNLRLAPVPGTPEKTHARYRGRPGAGIAVVTLSAFPAAPAAETYQAWARHGATWTSLGTVAPDADGSARLIAEDPAPRRARRTRGDAGAGQRSTIAKRPSDRRVDPA
jgi:hypothetical protein